ncbi:cadherin-like domain-containing protein, partial [Psychrobacter sp. NPDC078501]|uniref:cadherin-like domain-containing protein n=1 Tax=Psychrobacter sp. NPDC078501 TaxID=3364495 RepID=UPI00384E744C
SDVEAADIASITYTNAAGIPVTITGSTAIQNVLNGTTVLEVKVPAGSTAAPLITVTTNNDDIYENSEQLSFVVTGADNAAIDNTAATGTIVDEDRVDDSGDQLGDFDDSDESQDTDQGEAVNGNLLDNATDTDPSITLNVANVQVDTNGDGIPDTVITIGSPVAITDNGSPVGSLTVNVDGSYSFTPDADFTGDVPVISYDIVDSASPTDVLDSSELNITVIPGPVEIAISATKATSTEQIGNTDTLEFTLTQNVASDKDSNVRVTLDGSSPNITASDIARLQYTKADGTVVNTTDQSVIANFLTDGDTVQIAAGSKVSTVIFTIADDSAYEQTENLGLVISNPVNPNGISITTNTDSGVISDESNNPADPLDGSNEEGDRPTVSITATDAQAIESEDNVLSYTVKQDNLSNLATTVQVKVDVNNSDVEAADIASITYTNAAGIPVTITGSTAIQNVLNGTTVLEVKVPAGSTAAPLITVTTNNDDIYENSEQLSFVVTGADNAAIDNTAATGTIVDE